ncbi:MAG: hypothetical protein M3297_13935 [Thermoproteota archaeon]|nr:hypothetical protein [Thermoproteota archaeon]
MSSDENPHVLALISSAATGSAPSAMRNDQPVVCSIQITEAVSIINQKE